MLKRGRDGMNNIHVIIPVYNPNEKFLKLLKSLSMQTVESLPVLIIDSGVNSDYVKDIPDNLDVQIKHIDVKDFNHGGTRQMGMELCPDSDVFVFLTQDAILKDTFTIERLVRSFDDEQVGCSYGRQLPHSDATFFSSIARSTNYPPESNIRSFEDHNRYGMKTAFISNSFAAYRKIAMQEVGGFPTDTILSEDMCVAAQMLLNGWKVAYVSDACVYHSHNYTILQEFKRYFDIGVFHAREKWIRDSFGQAEGAGLEFVKMEINAILKRNPLLFFEMFARDGMKFLGYRLGLHEAMLSSNIKKHISMTRRYWD
ncbi:glycosyltransferase [Mitsuokella multacida]|uniref:glycosyltransferase n=1 Tax=Mitsuokella multacida TaxID=52226 RepID=UPI0022E1D093|nr:glycosyltransferase family 2 protein [Mitsuokella multacida]